MPALFDHEMALAAVDPWKLRPDGSSNWSVHYFDRLGRWTGSATGMSKDEAKKKAVRVRRKAREEMKEKVMGKKIHWAGGLELPKTRMLPGWPCCCSGRTAERVAAEGNQTRNILEVTCQRCKANMVKAGLMEEV